MGIDFGGLADKAKGLINEHGDKIEDGLEKAGAMVNQKTGGKHEDKIDKGLAKAKEGLDKAEGKDGDNPAPPMATGPAEPPQPTTPPPGPPMG